MVSGRAQYLKHREKILAQKREYHKRPEVKARLREYCRKNREIKNAQSKALYHKVPLKRTCEICGTMENLQRHHPDYSKPLEVVTVCGSCHMRIHVSGVA